MEVAYKFLFELNVCTPLRTARSRENTLRERDIEGLSLALAAVIQEHLDNRAKLA